MRRLLMTAMMLWAMTAGRAEADLILVAQAGSGVNLSNIHVGQAFEIDLLMEGSNPNEYLTSTNGGFFFGSTNLAVTSAGFGPNPSAPLTTNPVLFVFDYVATAAGPAYFFDSYDSFNPVGTITTNLASYSPVSNTLTFTILPAAAVPEPASAFMLGLGLAGVGVAGWRRSRRAIA